jgi:hypothetical protein
MSAIARTETAGLGTLASTQEGIPMSKTRFHTAGSLALCAVSFLICATPAVAAGKISEAQATYNRDRADCMKSDVGDRQACLREAGAALQEAKRGGLTNETAQLEKNRLARCDNQPPQDRAECVRRMNEGTVTGSVKSGAVVRELRTVVPAK